MWTADKIYYQGSSGYTRAYQGSELVWVIDTPLQSISISGETIVNNSGNTATYTVNYTPSNTTETGVTWSIDGGLGVGVVTGNTYVTIDANSGVLTVLSAATYPTPITIIATSVVNSSITDSLNISVIYYEDRYFKLTAKQANSTVGLNTKSTNQTLEYSTDGSTWLEMTTATTINLSSGDTVYLRGILSSNNSSSNYTQFNMSGNIKASGNINYLWNKNNPNSVLKNWCGFNLFMSCTALTDASELELPSMTLAERCYSCMFIYASGLTEAPALPATTMANDCYRGMFQDCSGLTTAPELPAATLAPRCYRSMFYACRNLSYIKCLATNISATDCTIYWTEKVNSSGTFVKASSMASWRRGNSGIPYLWTITDA